MKKLLSFLAITIILLNSCKKEDEEIRSGSGYFKLTEIRNIGTKSTQGITNDSIKMGFQLGDLKNSNAFYFLLSNGGDNPIFDVNLKTDNSHFITSPERINVLPASNTNNDGTIIPLISLGVIHGTQINGIGFAEILPMGENLATLTITGKTLENGDTINLQSDFYFSVNARLMDIKLFDDEQEVDLRKPYGSFAGPINLGGLGFVRYYKVSAGSVQLQNTGNVDITLIITQNDNYGKYSDLDPVIIPQNETLRVILNEHLTVFNLDSEGTITDFSRIQLGDDGNGYFAIEKIVQDSLQHQTGKR